ncbi:MAG: hypothetical protein ACP5O1_05300 [Phycisphaerae bacterium]
MISRSRPLSLTQRLSTPLSKLTNTGAVEASTSVVIGKLSVLDEVPGCCGGENFPDVALVARQGHRRQFLT